MTMATDRRLVDKLCNIESGLTDWEVQFVEDIASTIYDSKHALSVRQRMVAERLLEDKG